MNTAAEYRALIEKVSRRPLRPAIGVPVFVLLFSIALIAKNVAGATYAGLVLLLLLLVFPYYVVQLLMRHRMQKHMALALKLGTNPSYVPRSARVWAGVYVCIFLATAAPVVAIDRLTTGHLVTLPSLQRAAK